MFSDLTRSRIKKFKGMKRAYYSSVCLGVAFILSLASHILVNDKPIFFIYQNQTYFPIFSFYSSQTFGEAYKTEANYRTLFQDPKFYSEVSFSIFPPIRHDPLYVDLHLEGEPPHAPSSKHWLGTDEIGRDVLARLIYGFRNCMLFSLLLTLITTCIAVVLGGVQGYLGGWFDFFMQRGIEIWSSLPFLYVVIVIGAIYGRGFITLVLSLAIFGWIGLSYYMRSEFLKLKDLSFVHSARALGVPGKNIFFKHLLPNALTPLITVLPFSVISGIVSLTSLDFLGFGLAPPTPSWGELLSQGLNHIYAPWIALSTVMAMFITLLLTAFIGEGVREAFDPKGQVR